MADSGGPPYTPVNNNPGQVAKSPYPNPPTSQSSQGPPMRTSLLNGVPAGAPGGVQVGTPMDKADTCPC